MDIKVENRLASADILKVIAITAVVFIHGSSLLSTCGAAFGFPAFIYNLTLMLRFCVPVFIFLWAYFQEKSTLKHGSFKLLYARFYVLLIPFFFWSFVYFILSADFKTLTLTTAITKHWTGFGWAGQYYFIILFQLTLLFPVLRWFSIRIGVSIPLLYVFSLIFYVLISYTGWLYIDAVGKIGDRPFIYWLPYVVLGITYVHKNIFPVKIPLILGMVFTALIPMEFYFFNLREVGIYLHPGIFVASFILLSSLEVKISYAALSRPVTWAIQVIAKNTLAVFCLNPLVIMFLAPVFRSYKLSLNFVGACIVGPILSTAIILMICILITSTLKRLKLGILVTN
jgi:hypothetical protein